MILSSSQELDHALNCLSREDPSLRVSTDEDSGQVGDGSGWSHIILPLLQTILSGMGELHLEVVLDRIRRDYKVDADIGKLQVSYREAPSTTATQSGILAAWFTFYTLLSSPLTLESVERTMGSQSHSVSVTLTLAPSPSTGREPQILVPSDSSLTFPPSMTMEEVMSAVRSGVDMACASGACTKCIPITLPSIPFRTHCRFSRLSGDSEFVLSLRCYGNLSCDALQLCHPVCITGARYYTSHNHSFVFVSRLYQMLM